MFQFLGVWVPYLYFSPTLLVLCNQSVQCWFEVEKLWILLIVWSFLFLRPPWPEMPALTSDKYLTYVVHGDARAITSWEIIFILFMTLMMTLMMLMLSTFLAQKNSVSQKHLQLAPPAPNNGQVMYRKTAFVKAFPFLGLRSGQTMMSDYSLDFVNLWFYQNFLLSSTCADESVFNKSAPMCTLCLWWWWW